MSKKKQQELDRLMNSVAAREQKFILVGNLSEAKFDVEKRTAEVTVIRKGWSKNGFYYGDKALDSIANFLNTSAEKVYLNHNKRSEIFEPRKEEDHIANNTAAVVATDGQTVVATAKYFESGPNNWVFQRMGETPHTIGPSIVGKAKIRQGTAEGRKGPIVEDVTYLHSYDMVSAPSAGGTVNSLSEAENVCSSEGCEFVHVYEGLVSDEDQAFLLEALGQSDNEPTEDEDDDVDEEIASTKLKERLAQKKDRRKATDDWYDLEYTFTSELGNIVLAREDYEFMSIVDRKKLVQPLVDEFSKETSKIKFVSPRPIPKATGSVTETEVSEEQIKIILHSPGSFEKNTFRKIIVSKENGITATIGKLKKGNRKSDIHSYQFDISKGWTETLVKKWISKNVKSKSITNTKEGVEPMFENLEELKKENPGLYEKLVAEAQNDQQAQEQVKKWKDDSDKLTTETESLTTMTTERDTLKTEKETLETENKTLKDENVKHTEQLQVARKAELISEVKKEVGLAEELCSKASNKTLNNIVFDPEKESEFKANIKEQVEDRKSSIEDSGDTTKDKIVKGAGQTKSNTPVTEDTKVIGNEEFASNLKEF